jgi:hypothetical protein
MSGVISCKRLIDELLEPFNFCIAVSVAALIQLSTPVPNLDDVPLNNPFAGPSNKSS